VPNQSSKKPNKPARGKHRAVKAEPPRVAFFKTAEPERWPLHLQIFEAAAVLNCSDQQVRDLVEAGELAAFSIADQESKRTHPRIPRAALLSFIEKRLAASQTPVAGGARS
jgi:excisionase family DNA binding protein